jgi:hypothetical protein
VTPTSSEMTVEPVKMAISFNMAFLLSPKDGALTAHTCNPAWILFTIKLARGSLSISSAIIKRGLFFYIACYKNFKMCLKDEILCSDIKISGFSY